MISIINNQLKNVDLFGVDENKIKEVFSQIINAIHKYNLKGACHVSSSFMYLLLRELNVEVTLCTGWVKCDKNVFGHSWIEYKGHPIDAAVSLGNIQSFPPVLLGNKIHLPEALDNNYIYGYSRNIQLEKPMDNFSIKPLGVYLEGLPSPLCSLFNEISIALGVLVDIDFLKAKYFDTQWLIKK